MEKEYIAIGDIHGCLDELKTLVDMLPNEENTELVFLGDYVDRGYDSKGVIDYLLKLQEERTIRCLIGNHEVMFLDFLKKPDSQAGTMFIYNGGGSTLASYGDEEGYYDVPDEHLEFLNNLLPFYETEQFFFVHAGVPDIPLSKLKAPRHIRFMLWTREEFFDSSFDWGKVIVHGHTPVGEVEQHDRRINLDTGCVFDNKLTAMRLSDRKIYHVEKKEPYRALYLTDSSGRRKSQRFKASIQAVLVKGETPVFMQTVDFNEFGVLLKASSPTEAPMFTLNEQVVGEMGEPGSDIQRFEGKVVRVSQDRHGMSYAVKFSKVTLEKMDSYR